MLPEHAPEQEHPERLQHGEASGPGDTSLQLLLLFLWKSVVFEAEALASK